MKQHPVPEKLLAQIGDIVVSFALLEMFSRELLGCLLREGSRVCQIMTVELSFKTIRALTMSLYLERYGKDDGFSDLKRLMNRATELEVHRNLIIHSLWGADRSRETFIRLKVTAKESAGLRFQHEKVTEESLGSLSRDINDLSNDLSKFMLRL